ncbi:MAG: TonB-dependent receptor, partial [Bacteroidales bacterium]
FAVSFAFAQNITVTGTVSDAKDKYPLTGAGVQIKGHTGGVATDLDGKYSINANAKDVLVFSYLNYLTIEIPIGGRSVINVELKEDVLLLDETVVIGYGTAKKISSVVGAATTVKTKVFENRPVASAGDALQGQVAGLQVFTSSGEPSATVSMRLRGVNSINASTSPLFILDGSPVSSSVFTTLSSNDIANITVLKDASSTAIYGSRAANGVVYITTKKGTSEKATIKLGVQYGLSNLANNPQDMMNSTEYFNFREMADPALLNNTQFQDLKKFRLGNNISTDWRKWILNENAPTVSGDLSISGRTNSTDYYISLGAFDQDGIEPYSSLTRYSIRSNINTKLNSWLKFGINLGLTYQETETAAYSSRRNSWSNPMSIADWYLPYATPYDILTDDNGNFIGYGEEQQKITDMGTWNYHYLVGLQPSSRSYLRLNGNMYQEISPIKGLVFRAVQALEGFDYRAKDKVLGDKNKLFTTSASERFDRSYRLTATNTGEYKFSVAKDNNFVVLLGQEAIISNYEWFSASSTGQSDNRTNNVNQGLVFGKPGYELTESASNSYFARLSYDYKEKYFLDATFRSDGSSLFGANKRYANFYSVGAMWNVKSESFLKKVDWVNKLQFKASYGTTGNSGINEYLANGLMGVGANYDGKPTWYLSSVDNPDLTWETIEALNIGISTRLFNFMNVELEFYNKNTKDMLLEIPYSYATGFSGGWGNVGNMRNRGVDLTLGFDILSTKDFYLNVTGNFNYNKNEVTALFGGRDEFVVANTGIKYQVGKALGDFYYVRYAGVDPATGKQLWLDKDDNVTTEYSEDNSVFTGKQRYAPYAAGLQIDFSWKGLSASASLSGVFGKWTLNNTRYFTENANFSNDMNQTTEMLNMWTTPGQITSIPRAGETRHFDTHILENASFVRLKNVQIAYDFPKTWMNKTGFLSGLRVYVVGRNLLTFTNYSGYDPEVDSNLQLGNYPNSRQYSFGIELTF